MKKKRKKHSKIESVGICRWKDSSWLVRSEAEEKKSFFIIIDHKYLRIFRFMIYWSLTQLHTARERLLRIGGNLNFTSSISTPQKFLLFHSSIAFTLLTSISSIEITQLWTLTRLFFLWLMPNCCRVEALIKRTRAINIFFCVTFRFHCKLVC